MRVWVDEESRSIGCFALMLFLGAGLALGLGVGLAVGIPIVAKAIAEEVSCER